MKNRLLILGIFAMIQAPVFGQSDCIMVCNSNINVSLNNQGEATLQPEMILEGTIDPACSPFFQIKLTDAAGTIIHPYGPELNINCSDIGDYTATVSVIDNGTVYTSCWTSVTIEDKLNVCTFNTAPNTFPLNIIGKKITNYASKVFLNGNELNKVVTGLYEVPKIDILSGQNEITFESYNSSINGVSTLDLVMIQRVILEIQNPDNFTIAGDFDKSNFIGVRDLVELRDLILGMQSTNTFRFINSGLDYSNFDPFDFGTDIYSYKFNDTDTSNIVFDFNVIQGGDVNNNYNFRGDDSSENRGPKSKLTYKDQRVESGQTYIIDFSLQSDDMISGLQASFDLSNFESSVELISNYTIEELKSNTLGDEFRISYINEQENAFNMTLRLTPAKSGDLSSLLKLKSSFIQELVSSNLDTKTIELSAKTTTAVNDLDLTELKITPNPMTSYTQLSLPQNDSYDLKVIDFTGKVLIKERITGSTYSIYNDRFEFSGVYVVSVKSATFEGVQKLVVIK